MTARIQNAAILSTGDEIVGGRTVDTNSSYLADGLSALGIDVVAVLTVGDYPDRIDWAWRQALGRADVVISTGGLGPTADDRTTETLAQVAGVDLHLDEGQAARIRRIFEQVGRPMPENNLKQAMLPAGAQLIANPLGTAPGYRMTIGQADGRQPVAIVLPGVPREMRAMFKSEVSVWLASRVDEGRCLSSRTFQVFGMSESALDEALAGVITPEEGRLSFRASFPQISLRVAVMDACAEEAEARLDSLAGRIEQRLGEAVYAQGDDTTMEEVVGRLLREHGKSLATAESCTGGLVGNRLTNVPGSSDYYRGGIVAYSNDVKEKTLGVSRSTLAMFGAVSEETACEMALGVQGLLGADLAVATTGIAGPAGATATKPVGTVAVALATDRQAQVCSRSYRLWGEREFVKTLTSQLALDWVRRFLLGLDPLASSFGRRRPGRPG